MGFKKAGFTILFVGLLAVCFYGYKIEWYSHLSGLVSTGGTTEELSSRVQKVSPSGEDFVFAMPSSSLGWKKVNSAKLGEFISSEEEKLRRETDKLRKEKREELLPTLKFFNKQAESFRNSEKSLVIANRKGNPIFSRASYFSFKAAQPVNHYKEIEDLIRIEKQYKARSENSVGEIISLGGKSLVLKVEDEFEAVFRNHRQKISDKSLIFIANNKQHVINFVSPKGSAENGLFGEMIGGLRWTEENGSEDDFITSNKNAMQEMKRAFVIGSVFCFVGIGFICFAEREGIQCT